MSEKEQNKRINEHQRLINNLRERLKTLELDEDATPGVPPGARDVRIEPQGRIDNAFDAIEEHLEEHDKRFDAIDKRLDNIDHKLNQLSAKFEIVIEHLTKVNDLPEE